MLSKLWNLFKNKKSKNVITRNDNDLFLIDDFLNNKTNKEEDFDEDLFYCERFDYHRYVTELDSHLVINCPKCNAKHKTEKESGVFNCHECNTKMFFNLFQLFVFDNSLEKQMFNQDCISIIHENLDDHSSKYKFKGYLSDVVFTKALPSTLIIGKHYEIDCFKCPNCALEYEEIGHGQSWTCKCTTEFISFGNSLSYDVDIKGLIQRKVKSF